MTDIHTGWMGLLRKCQPTKTSGSIYSVLIQRRRTRCKKIMKTQINLVVDKRYNRLHQYCIFTASPRIHLCTITLIKQLQEQNSRLLQYEINARGSNASVVSRVFECIYTVECNLLLHCYYLIHGHNTKTPR